MNRQVEHDITAIRLRFLDLLKSFFDREPDDARLKTWQEVFAGLATEQINPAMDSAARNLDTLLASMSADEIREEFYELFIDPFSSHSVGMTLSYYRDGHDFGRSLVELRDLLSGAGIVRATDTDQSEDSLLVLLDILACLIREEENDPDFDPGHAARLLKSFLEPLTDYLNTAMQENDRARFFQACTRFLSGYIDLEKGLLTAA